jgi:hypothetical protein
MKRNGLLSVEEVAALLRDMRDAEGVALLCAMLGIRGGKPLEAGECPVTRLVTMLTGRSIEAGYCGLYDASESAYMLVGAKLAAIPRAAASFAEQYDDDRWPELRAS